MAHYAWLDENNIVINVSVGVDENETIEGLSVEEWCSRSTGFKIIRTSYNGKIRGTYAGIGYSYNADEDIFISPQPYSSWTRSGSFWNPPTPMPADDKMYEWVEVELAWVEIVI